MKAEKIIKYTDKGYSYIICERKDCFAWGGLGICDSCGKSMEEPIYLIFILGQAFCKKCFDEWVERAKRYEEDIFLQKQNHIRWYEAHEFRIRGEEQ